jgi:hypothetical protein
VNRRPENITEQQNEDHRLDGHVGELLWLAGNPGYAAAREHPGVLDGPPGAGRYGLGCAAAGPGVQWQGCAGHIGPLSLASAPERFEFGLDCVLDGIAAKLARLRQAADPPGREPQPG